MSLTATSKRRLVDATTLLSVSRESTSPCGCAVTDSMPVPCRPLPVLVPPPVDAPRRRLTMSANVTALVRSAFVTTCERGTATPCTPCSLRICSDGRLEQVVPHDVAREESLRLLGEDGARLRGVLRLRRRLERVREAAQPADPELQRLDHLLVRVAQVPGRVERLRVRDVLLLLLREPAQLLLELRLLDARRDEHVVQRPARLRRGLRDRTRRPACSPCTPSTSRRSGSPGSRTRAGRRRGSRARSGRRGAGSASGPRAGASAGADRVARASASAAREPARGVA